MERSILFFGHTAPDVHFTQFHRELARELGVQGWTVLWVSPPAPYKGVRWWLADAARAWRRWSRVGRASCPPASGLPRRVARALRFLLSGELESRGPFWDFRPWGSALFPHPGTPILDWVAVGQIRQAMRRIGMNLPVVVLYTPHELPFARALKSEGIAYWVGDDSAVSHDPEIRSLLRTADLVLAISPEGDHLARQLRPGRPVIRTGTGVSLRTVRGHHPEPPGFDSIPRPIVGYAGSVNAIRFDADLFLGVAGSIPEASFVIVGPIEEEIRNRIEGAGGNVFVLGEKPFEEVPACVGCFDVGIVPYLLNDFNLGSNPLKVYEYLALNKPVVSVAIPAVAELGSVVHIASGVADFTAAVREALKADDLPAGARAAVAEEHSTGRIARELSQGLMGLA